MNSIVRSLFLGWLGLSAIALAEPLPVVVVQPRTVDLGFSAEAVVEAVNQATLGAQLPGRVLEARVDAGQTVARGQLLMRIDAREAGEAARAAEAQYRVAKQNYQRHQQLKTQQFVSQAAVDRAKADYDAAAANRSAAGVSQSHASIVSPISGVVARRYVEAGDMVMPGTPLLTVYQPGSLRLTASVPQHRQALMRGVTSATVSFPELARTVVATSVQLLPTADPATHVFQVRVGLPNLPEVSPGMFARVRFVTGQAEKLTVPAAAIVRRGELTAVYVYAASGRPSLRQIRLGEALGDAGVEVLAGLAAGDRVITDPVKAAIVLKSGS